MAFSLHEKHDINPIFRAKLRKWEVENTSAESVSDIAVLSGETISSVVNISGDFGNATEFDLALFKDEEHNESQTHSFSEKDNIEVGTDRTYLVSGDMVALKYDNLLTMSMEAYNSQVKCW